MTTLALAGDMMLGRTVGERLADRPARSLFGDDLLEVVAATDGMVLNLECCISDRGSPWPGRVFHFRAPPSAVDALNLLGVRCVTLANNHAMDFGAQALLDTLGHLRRAGIAAAGAGADEESARAAQTITVGDASIAVVSFTDHPAEYSAGADRPGVAWADLGRSVPAWVTDRIRQEAGSGTLALVSPHWGPNMTEEPLRQVRSAAGGLVSAGAGLVAGHSAHVFHGVVGRVLFDMGDFIDDYAVGPLRNDLGLLWLVTIEGAVPDRVEVVPLRLGFCRTTLAVGDDARWIRERFTAACRALGADVTDREGRLVVHLA